MHHVYKSQASYCHIAWLLRAFLTCTQVRSKAELFLTSWSLTAKGCSETERMCSKYTAILRVRQACQNEP